MNKKTLMLIVVFLGIFFLSNTSHAALNWYKVTVESIGPDSTTNTVLVFLTDTAASPAFTQKWFRTDPDQTNATNQIMAMILTAATNNLTLWVYVDIDSGLPYPVIKLIYLNPA